MKLEIHHLPTDKKFLSQNQTCSHEQLEQACKTIANGDAGHANFMNDKGHMVYFPEKILQESILTILD